MKKKGCEGLRVVCAVGSQAFSMGEASNTKMRNLCT